MAKSAKAQEVEVTPRVVNKIISDILGHYSELESARGSFMNRARRIKEHIQSVIDGAAARGLPPKLVKLQIRIEQTQSKLQEMLAELDSEERKLIKKIVTAHGDRKQMALFNDLPEAVKPPKEVVLNGNGSGKKASSSKPKPEPVAETAATEAAPSNHELH